MKNLLVILVLLSMSSAITLKEAYDMSGPGEGYDKLVILEKGRIYKGGLYLGKFFNPFTILYDQIDERSVRIKGNGAILDLMNGQIHTGYTNSVLDIDSCVIMNGTVRYTGYMVNDTIYFPHGTVKNVTFYKPIDYAVRAEGCGTDLKMIRNLVYDCVSTGLDYAQWDTMPYENIITGPAFAYSNYPYNGFPEMKENWIYNSIYTYEPLSSFAGLDECG